MADTDLDAVLDEQFNLAPPQAQAGVTPEPVVPPTEPIAPEPAPPAADPGAAPQAPEPPAPPAEPAAPIPPPVKLLERVRTNTMTELNKVTVSIMADNRDMTPTQAEAVAREHLGLPPLAAPAPSAPPSEPDAQVTDRAPQTVEEYDAALELIEQEMRDAGKNGFTDILAEKQIEHGRLAAQRAVAESRAQDREAHAEEQAHTQWQTENAASLARAHALHPDMAKPETELGQEVARIIENMDENDPVLQSPHRAELIAVRALANKGLAPVTGKPAAAPAAAPAPTQPPAVPPRLNVPPLLPGSQQSSIPGPMTPQAEAALIDSTDDPAALHKLLYGNQPKPVLR